MKVVPLARNAFRIEEIVTKKKLLTYSVNSFLKSFTTSYGFAKSVRKKGLEPPRLAAPDPKSGAATNYATSAFDF